MDLENIKDSSCADSQEEHSSEVVTNAKEIQKEDTKDSKVNNDNNLKKVETIETESKDESNAVSDNEFDQNLYNEILEKLDIVKKEKKDVQEDENKNKLMQEKGLNNKINDLELNQTKMQIEKDIAQDFDKIQKLMQLGLISSVQGQNLKKEVLKKAFDKLVQTEKIRRNVSSVLQNFTANNEQDKQINIEKGFEEFKKSNPDFFNLGGRKEVLDYLKSGGVVFGKDEFSKISDIIRSVEKAAIDRYLKKVSYEKNLRDSNEAAKQRLTANAQKSSFSDKNLSRTFTREQIGKMSSAEFMKYESLIMEQLKKGLIR